MSVHTPRAASTRRLMRLAGLTWVIATLLCCAGSIAAAGASDGRGSISGLPKATYAAVEKALVASLPLDSGVRAPWRRAFRASCMGLSRRLRLLAAFRRVCLVWATSYDVSAAYQNCANLEPANPNQLARDNLINRCEARADLRFAVVNLELVSAFVALNKDLKQDVRSTLCRASFGGTPAALRLYKGMVPLFRLMATGLLRNSPQKSSDAEIRAQRLQGNNPVPTNHQQLSEFKRGCA